MSRRFFISAIAMFALALPTTSSFAQEIDQEEERPSDAKDIYGGVIPGKRDSVRHIDRSKPGRVQWIGMIPDKTRTRVFVKLDDGVDYEQSGGEAGQLVFTFANTKAANTNVMRPIDASHFDRDVKRVDVKRSRKNLVVTITVEPGTSPNIQRRNGYIYIDFAHTPEESSEDA